MHGIVILLGCVILGYLFPRAFKYTVATLVGTCFGAVSWALSQLITLQHQTWESFGSGLVAWIAASVIACWFIAARG